MAGKCPAHRFFGTGGEDRKAAVAASVTKRLPAVKFDARGAITFRTEDQKLRDAVLKGRGNFSYFARTFLPGTFYEAMDAQHREANALFDDWTIPMLAQMAWRGFGKSSTFGGLTIQRVIYRTSRFVLYVGAGYDQAAGQTDDIRQELLTNDILLDVFGDMRPRAAEGEMKLGFSKKGYYLTDPWTREPVAFVQPKGAGQLVRGLNVRLGREKVRPDFIGVDDLENDEDVLNDESRIKLRRWFHGALKHVVPRVRPASSGPNRGRWARPSSDPWWRPPWQIVVLDTLKHQDAMIAHLVESSEFVSGIFPKAVLENGEWRSLTGAATDADVRREIERAQEENTFDSYCREMLCMASDPGERFWTRDMYQYYRDADMHLNEDDRIKRFLTLDPTRSKTRRSCPGAITAYAVDRRNALIYNRGQIVGRMTQHEQADALFEAMARFNSYVVGVEKTGAAELIEVWFESEAARRGVRVEWIWLGSMPANGGAYGPGREGAKTARAAQLARLYAPDSTHPSGHIMHEESLRNGPLESQELGCPDNRYWDAIDSAGFLVPMMDKLDIVFDAQTQEARQKLDLRELEIEELMAAGAYGSRFSDDW